jgi:hypothetical protein
MFLCYLNIFITTVLAYCYICIKQVIQQLCIEFSIPEDQIPSDKSIHNRLNYYCKQLVNIQITSKLFRWALSIRFHG